MDRRKSKRIFPKNLANPRLSLFHLCQKQFRAHLTHPVTWKCGGPQRIASLPVPALHNLRLSSMMPWMQQTPSMEVQQTEVLFLHHVLPYQITILQMEVYISEELNSNQRFVSSCRHVIMPDSFSNARPLTLLPLTESCTRSLLHII